MLEYPEKIVLPHLAVFQDKYCSQLVVDKAVAHLETHRQDLLKQLYERAGRAIEEFQETTSKVDRYLLEESTSGRLEMPVTYLGRLDLSFEICRRFESAFGIMPFSKRNQNFPSEGTRWEITFFTVKGAPLGPSEEGPFVPMPNLPLESSSKEEGISQDAADYILQRSYKEHPKDWYELAETYRRSMQLFLKGFPTYEYREEVFGGTMNEAKFRRVGFILSLEAIGRLRTMCNLI
jgi:hypothetical protein